MKTTFKIAVAALAMLGTTSAARADLTYQGAVGLPLNPTAQIPLPGGVRVQADYSDLGEAFNSDAKFYGIHGAGRLGERLEINGGVSKLDADGFLGDFDRTGIDIGAKYLLTRETDPAGVRFAVGAGYSHALFKNIHAYAVGTKSFGTGIAEGRAPITGHLGLRFDRYRFGDGFFGDDSNKLSIYGGVEVPFTRTGDFAFVGELQSKTVEDGGKFPYSASVRYRPVGQGFSASVGIKRQGLLSDNGLFAQIGYSFGHSDDNTAADTETNATIQ